MTGKKAGHCPAQMTDVCYRTSAAIEADNTLTSVEPYTSFRPKRETTLPCSSFRPLIAPAIIPIDEKLAKETEEDRDNAFRARGERRGNFLQIHHGDEFIGDQFGSHNTAHLQRFACRHTHHQATG